MDILIGQDDAKKHHCSKSNRSLKTWAHISKKWSLHYPPSYHRRSCSLIPLATTFPITEQSQRFRSRFRCRARLWYRRSFDAMSMNTTNPPPPSTPKSNSDPFTLRLAHPLRLLQHLSKPDRPKTRTGPFFVFVLMQASHSKCESETTSDLLSIFLNKNNFGTQT